MPVRRECTAPFPARWCALEATRRTSPSSPRGGGLASGPPLVRRPPLLLPASAPCPYPSRPAPIRSGPPIADPQPSRVVAHPHGHGGRPARAARREAVPKSGDGTGPHALAPTGGAPLGARPARRGVRAREGSSSALPVHATLAAAARSRSRGPRSTSRVAAEPIVWLGLRRQAHSRVDVPRHLVRLGRGHRRSYRSASTERIEQPITDKLKAALRTTCGPSSARPTRASRRRSRSRWATPARARSSASSTSRPAPPGAGRRHRERRRARRVAVDHDAVPQPRGPRALRYAARPSRTSRRSIRPGRFTVTVPIAARATTS